MTEPMPVAPPPPSGGSGKASWLKVGCAVVASFAVVLLLAVGTCIGLIVQDGSSQNHPQGVLFFLGMLALDFLVVVAGIAWYLRKMRARASAQQGNRPDGPAS
jgi:hypothetical protein